MLEICRHLDESYSLSELAPGQRFLPASQDPTSPGSPLPDVLLTQYTGYSNVTMHDRTGTANYNSMQTQVNRRFARGLQMGASWTWAHAMAESGTVPKYNPLSLTGYSPQGVRHLLVVDSVLRRAERQHDLEQLHDESCAGQLEL